MTRRLHAVLAAVLLASPGQAAALPAPPQPTRLAAPEPSWTAPLRARLEAADARYPGAIGVYVRHLGRDEAFSFRAEETWYLASGVKIPVAIAVMRAIERGELALDGRIRLLPEDFVDGAGQTNSHPAGTRLRIDYLLEQMIVYSDNTATDVLIRSVGLDRVNAVAGELLAADDLVITTLADVRRRAYASFHPGAASLGSADLLALRRAGSGTARVRKLADLLQVTTAEFLQPDLDGAFDAYYASNVNAAPLRDFGRMLAMLSDGLALAPEGTAYLLEVMSRVKTGDRRIKAGLPHGARFAHKTGTQHRRACDMGIVTMQGTGERVVVAACARGSLSLAASERALRDVGAAVTASGVLDRSTPVTRHWGPR
ncbi:serine hydrolase [Luteimonas sp. SJ-92]|uniref:Serine hydrolase n=1 Tax=Luteimonas salinisoli TaxID=2752307 RepID=A0A853J9V4_9GAMM|nr:serine hydrolase [Luteimonas salinisoli]NZA25635.1 serine hydrolase [Luteimonas salinisoli]